MMRALTGLPFPPGHLLIDALFLPEITIPQTALLKGDQRSLSIAAASILAKTARDRFMEDLALQAPDYGFEHPRAMALAVIRAPFPYRVPASFIVSVMHRSKRL